jgi:hypothetical protein
VASLNQGAPPAGFAILFRCAVGAVALLGNYHAVSACSAAITGVSATSPRGPLTTNAVGKVGQAFSYRIIVDCPGEDPDQALWDAVPLPPGLTINTNEGGNGWITGTPTEAGTFPVKLIAGNSNEDYFVYKDISIDIQPTETSPPLITGPPTNQIVSVGATVTFTVTASGSNLAYQWRFNGINLANGNTATLTLPNVTTNQSGRYSVKVSNSSSGIAHADARLLVVPVPGPDTAPRLEPLALEAGQITLSFVVAAGYRSTVESSDTLRPGSWVSLTNFPASMVASKMRLPQNVTTPRRLYRVHLTGN